MHKNPMHTSSPRVWLRNDRLGTCLVVIASMFCLPLAAADEKPQFTLQFVDVETKAPLVGARILLDAMNAGGRYGGPSFCLPRDPLDEPNWISCQGAEPDRFPPYYWAVTDA